MGKKNKQSVIYDIIALVMAIIGMVFELILSEKVSNLLIIVSLVLIVKLLFNLSKRDDSETSDTYTNNIDE